MQAMLQDVVAGQKHMLLIGNQGVGKNKLADRLLQLLQQEREYIQLHRDGNGKRLIDPAKVTIEEWHDEENIVELHPNFRMWVLANRPGFPFLGNNFFREIGDIFASHAIDNPDEESELSLLTAYAPSVPVDILRRLCRAFAELRELVENGTITYPYSTREAVAVAKHLQRFPNDGVASALENVLAFDAYDRNMRTQLSEIFLRYKLRA
ncbi:von Willebrand factor A domain-containing protein 8 [Phytophthora cinnamomi]|uniref:von Willebrand factor A domain-containing protein 8 n=1 Tax=Phytophthora cinnamomi TaxID=4785 RepID=UPI00355AA96A|nr:von Willebrand factor A domain-containing protein 8 [Phytophthora cinnamomi]